MLVLWLACVCVMPACAATTTQSGAPKNISILQMWSGDFPVAHLNRLPRGQQKSRVGYIDTAAIFAAVWQAFKPNEKVPEVDFSENFIVFSRNVDFYNRTSIARIILRDGVIEILAMSTRSALPIVDNVAMGLAVIQRAGVTSIQAGKRQISLSTDK